MTRLQAAPRPGSWPRPKTNNYCSKPSVSTLGDPFSYNRSFLAFWCDLAADAAIGPFVKFAKTVAQHWAGITNHTKYHFSNGIREGINSKVQLARARGYLNIQNIINVIYFLTGKLKFDYPLYST